MSPAGIVHHGLHPTTTGVHFASAASPRGWRVLAQPKGAHVRLGNYPDAGDYFWVECATFPLDARTTTRKTAGYLIDVHLHLRASLVRATLFDVVFIAQRDYLARFLEVNPNTFWLPLAAPAEFTEATRARKFDVGFVGNAAPGSRRREILDAIGERFVMNDWQRPHSVDEMLEVYRQSRVVVNVPVQGDLNMRFFEAMAAGAAVLTPQIENGMDEIARRDTHFTTADFDDTEAVLDRLAELLSTNEADAIGEQGRLLIRDRHTYGHRFAEVLERLDSATMAAPIRLFSDSEARRTFGRLAEITGEPRLATAGEPQGGDFRSIMYMASAAARRWKRRLSG